MYFGVDSAYTMSYLTDSLVSEGVAAVPRGDSSMNVTISFAPFTVTVVDTALVVNLIRAMPITVTMNATAGTTPHSPCSIVITSECMHA